MLTVGRIIRARRKERRLTLGAVANRLSTGTEEISAFERDERSLGDDLAASLIRFLELDAARLTAAATLTDTVRKLRPKPRNTATGDFFLADGDHFCTDRRAQFTRSWPEIESIAAAMRRILPVPATGKIASLELFERLDEITLPLRDDEYRVDYAVRKLPFGVEARTRADTQTRVIEVAVSPWVYREMVRGFPRTLFTVCHEIGHLVLHRSELVMPNAPGDRGSRIPAFASTEWQANAFAGAFIAPLHEVFELHDRIGSLAAIDLHRSFGFSRPAGELRLQSVAQRFASRITRPHDRQMPLPLR